MSVEQRFGLPVPPRGGKAMDVLMCAIGVAFVDWRNQTTPVGNNVKHRLLGEITDYAKEVKPFLAVQERIAKGER